MSEKNINMSDWEWDGVINTPERQTAADERAARKEARQASAQGLKKEFFSNFYEDREQHRKKYIETHACRSTLGAMGASVAAYFCGIGGINWLAWALGAGAAVLALIAAYGFGKIKEMGRR